MIQNAKSSTCMLDPLLYTWGVPPDVYQVCALSHAKWGDADLDHPSEPCHRNVNEWIKYQLKQKKKKKIEVSIYPGGPGTQAPSGHCVPGWAM